MALPQAPRARSAPEAPFQLGRRAPKLTTGNLRPDPLRHGSGSAASKVGVEVDQARAEQMHTDAGGLGSVVQVPGCMPAGPVVVLHDQEGYKTGREFE